MAASPSILTAATGSLSPEGVSRGSSTEKGLAKLTSLMKFGPMNFDVHFSKSSAPLLSGLKTWSQALRVATASLTFWSLLEAEAAKGSARMRSAREAGVVNLNDNSEA